MSGGNVRVRRILIVGLGSIGERYSRIISQTYPDISIAVLRHSSCDDPRLSLLGIHTCFLAINDAIAFKPDVAILANPASLHLDVAFKLAESGIHLMIEKPLSVSSHGIGELVSLCKSKKIILMTGYNLRFLPSLNYFRKFLLNGKLGELYSVRAEVGQYLPAWRPGCDYRKTVSAQKNLGGGVLLELSHEIDYLLWIFGPMSWVQSYMSKQSDLEIDVEDVVHVLCGFQKQEKYQSALTGVVTMDCIRHDTTRYCLVIGSLGTLRWDAVAGKVEYFPKDGERWEDLYVDRSKRDDTYREEIRHVISCVESGEPPLYNGKDGLETMVAVDAVVQSSMRQKRIYIKHS